MNQTLQDQLLAFLESNFIDFEVKKINRDNFMDIHFPIINPQKGTHLFFNTSRNKIKLGFYCRDQNWVNDKLNQSDSIETYSNGLVPKFNPSFSTVDEAAPTIVSFLNVLGVEVAASNVSKEEAVESETKDISTENHSFELNEEYEGALCQVIKDHRLLTNFAFIPNMLREQGYEIDAKSCYFFASSIIWANNEEPWDLFVDLSGFHSSRGGKEFTLLFDWDSLADVKARVDQENNSIVIGLFQDDENFLTLEQKGSQSIRIIHYLYNYIYKDIIEGFRDSPVIIWEKIYEMGITLKNFDSYEEFYDLFES